MIVLDANVIVAFLDRMDALHGSAVQEIRKFQAERFITLNILLAEAYSVIARRCREKGKDCQGPLSVLREFESSVDIVWVEDIKERHSRIVDGIITSNGRLNYNDVVLMEFIKQKGVKLLTFDRILKKYLS